MAGLEPNGSGPRPPRRPADPSWRPAPRKRRSGTTFATTAALALIVVVLVVAGLLQLASNGTVKNQLGDKTFDAGHATALAPQVTSGGPIGLPPLLGKSRPIYLQHLGPDPAKGWVAIGALVAGEAAKCVLRWSQADMHFHDPCTNAAYPADGMGLDRYGATVLRSGRVDVDLRTLLPADTTITTGTVPQPLR